MSGGVSDSYAPKSLILKQESQFRYIGKAMPRLDIPEKVAGTGIYGLDVQVPRYALRRHGSTACLRRKTCIF